MSVFARKVLVSRLRKAEGHVTRRIAGETIIVPVRGGVGDLDSIYTLNEVGTKIWGLLDGKTGVDEIVRSIAGEHDVTEEEAARDVAEFLTELEERGLVRPTAANEN